MDVLCSDLSKPHLNQIPYTFVYLVWDSGVCFDPKFFKLLTEIWKEAESDYKKLSMGSSPSPPPKAIVWTRTYPDRSGIFSSLPLVY